MTKALNLSEYKTVAQLEALNPEVFKRARVLAWVRNAVNNGLAPFVLKHGKTVAVHEPSLRVWMRSSLRPTRMSTSRVEAGADRKPAEVRSTPGKKPTVKVSRARCWRV
jgi:hypothetical protein